MSVMINNTKNYNIKVTSYKDILDTKSRCFVDQLDYVTAIE